MTYYKKYGYKKNNFKNAFEISNYSISLPVGPHLNKENLMYIIKNLKNLFMKENNLENKNIALIGAGFIGHNLAIHLKNSKMFQF